MVSEALMKKIFCLYLLIEFAWLIVGILNMFVDNISKLSFFAVWINLMLVMGYIAISEYKNYRINKWEKND